MAQKSTADEAEHEISVILPNGQGLQISVQPTDTASIVRTNIYEQIGLRLPMRPQALLHRDAELDDSHCISELNLEEDAKFHLVNLVHGSFKVLCPLGEKYNFTVHQHEASESFGNILCSKFSEKCGICPDLRELRVFHDGRKVDAGIPFDELKLPDEATLCMCYTTPMSVTIQTPSGDEFVVETEPTDTLQPFVDVVQAATGLPLNMHLLGIEFERQVLANDQPLISYGVHHNALVHLINRGPQKLFVKIPSGKVIDVEFKPTATLHELVDMIHDKISVGLPVDPRYIRLSYRGRRLLPHYQICDYGIKGDCTLDLTFSAVDSMQFIVECYTGQRVNIEALPNDTIASVKEKIEKELKIPSEEQHLRYGQGRILMDNITLLECQIHNESKLSLDVCMDISVIAPDGKVVKVNCNSLDTMQDIKGELEYELGFPAKYQRILCGELELDDSAVLGDYHINKKSTLVLKLATIAINISTLKHGDVSIEVCLLESVDAVKARACRVLRLPETYVHTCKFYNVKQRLPDDALFYKLAIKPATTLGLYMLIDVSVQEDKNQKFCFKTDPSETVSNIKKMIESRTRLPVCNQRLMFGDTILDDDKKAISEFDLKDKSKIELNQVFTVPVTFGNEQLNMAVSSNDTVDDFKKMLFMKVVRDRREKWPQMFDYLTKSGPRIYISGRYTRCTDYGDRAIDYIGIKNDTKLSLEF